MFSTEQCTKRPTTISKYQVGTFERISMITSHKATRCDGATLKKVEIDSKDRCRYGRQFNRFGTHVLVLNNNVNNYDFNPSRHKHVMDLTRICTEKRTDGQSDYYIPPPNLVCGLFKSTTTHLTGRCYFIYLSQCYVLILSTAKTFFVVS